MNIPKPYPDEHVLGWRGRIKFFNHHPSVKHTIQELRIWHEDNHSGSDLPTKGASQLIMLSKASMLTVAEFVQRHTLIPFTRAFGPSIEEATPVELHNLLITHGLRLGKIGAWYCTSCIKQDLKEHGSSYWRRSHQLLGVDWCYTHRHRLRGVRESEAFDHDPIFGKERHKALASHGPKLLDEAEPVIQRYAAISLALLNSRRRFDRAKISAMIELQFLARQHIEKTETGGELHSVLETLAPPYWIERFVELHTKARNLDVLDFNRLFDQNIAIQSTERYVVALAMLFNSADTAIRQLEKSHDVKVTVPMVPLRGPLNPWLSEEVLNEYARHRCSHSHFADARGIELQSASNALSTHGLPDFGSGLDERRNALIDFFNGKSLQEVGEAYSVAQNELECALRVAGSRLRQALEKVGDVT